jgi:TonB family protein
LERTRVTHLGPSLRRTRRRARPLPRAVIAVAVSLLVNLAVLKVVRVGFLAPVRPGQAPKAVVLAPLSRSQWEANRSTGQAAPSRSPAVVIAPRPAPEPPPPNKANGQVVDVAPPKHESRPKDSRFVAEHDSTVEKETRSRYAKNGYENTLPKPSAPDATRQPSAQPDRVAGEGGHAGARDAPKPPQAAPGPAGSSPKSARERLALKSESKGDVRLRAPRQGVDGTPGALALARPPSTELPSTDAEGRHGTPGAPGASGNLQLRPSAANYDQLSGGPAPDKLDGVEEGEGTFLNTRGWKYAGYFNRISQAVREQWDPNGAMQARDPTGSRFPTQDWFTLLIVKLDDHGSLKAVSVQRSSGLDFLDNAAVQALQRAQPFVNPPRGLADERGEIVFSYGFTLQGGLGIHRLFRRPSEP